MLHIGCSYTKICVKLVLYKTEEEYCDRFAVIDQEVVWYGNINLLAKDKIDDSIMRVMSKDIACELMEITFGDSDGKGTEYNEN